MSVLEEIAAEPPKAKEPLSDSARRRLPKKVVGGVVIVTAFVLTALFAPLLAPYSPNAEDVPARLEPPSAEHPLGTDPLGRDVLSRVIYGTRIDLPVAILAVLFPAVLGTSLGSIAGYRGGWSDSLLVGIANVFQAFPLYIFLIALVYALGSGVGAMLIAFTAIDWVTYARLVRGEILRTRDLEYVDAARAAGIRPLRILGRHIMPNVVRQTYTYMPSDVVLAIIGIATLSYFNLGVPPPTAEWGSMIAQGQEYVRTEPLLTVAPGVAIMLLGTGFALIGDGLDDYLR